MNSKRCPLFPSNSTRMCDLDVICVTFAQAYVSVRVRECVSMCVHADVCKWYMHMTSTAHFNSIQFNIPIASIFLV